MRIPLKALWARVNDETVDDVLDMAAYGWFLVASLQILLLIVDGVSGRLAGGDVVDPIVAGLGGFFLRKTRSRAVAAALLLYGAITAMLCVAKFLGVAGNGVTLATSLVALYAGIRGLAAARFWQRRACAIADWRQVAVGTVLAVAITLAALLVMLGFTGGGTPDGWREFLLTAVLFLMPVAVLVWFTQRRPFARNDPACPWPPKR